MLCYIMSCSENWKFYQAQSMKVLGCGKDKYQRIIREIKDAGYLVVHSKHDDQGRLDGWIWEIIDDPSAQDVAGTSEEPPQPVACDNSARKPENPAIGEGCGKNDRKPGFTDSRVLPTDGKSGYLRKNNLQKEKLTSCADQSAHTSDLVFEDFVSQFEAAYPRLGDGPATVEALKVAIEAGADPAAILAGARAYAAEQKGNRKQYIAYSENWLRDSRWTQHTPTTTATEDRARILETHAKTIKDGKAFLCTAISDDTAWECVQAELVTIQDCRAVGKLL
jgi:hypothetical protein